MNTKDLVFGTHYKSIQGINRMRVSSSFIIIIYNNKINTSFVTI